MSEDEYRNLLANAAESDPTRLHLHTTLADRAIFALLILLALSVGLNIFLLLT